MSIDMSTTTTPELFAPLPENLATSPAAAEMQTLAGWRARGTFESVQRARADARSFVFWEGPPTANGRPGIHHVMARTIKDVVCRVNTMRGRRVVRKAGWDTHGLPVELEVEKRLGISGKPEIEKYGVARFNEECRKSVWTYRKEWEELSERIGYWLDYEHPYVTYEQSYVESIWYLLKRFHEKGLIYRGKRVLPYCGRCGTGLSSHELAQPGVYRDVLDPSVIVRFRVPDSKEAEPESFLAWTTTPWTLPSNVALAVHPEHEYVLARVALPVPKGAERGSAGYELVWLAKARADAVLGAQGKEYEIIRTVRGRDLDGRTYAPVFDARVPAVDPGAWVVDPNSWSAGTTWPRKIVLADYVTISDGTGIVHQAPAYGVDDWGTASKYKLPVLQAVGPEGRFDCDVGGREHHVKTGTFFKDADDALMDDLKERHLLFRRARENHSYPHCWRCDTPLFYFATPAWYIRTTAYKDRMVAQNEAIGWTPADIGAGRFGEWLANNIDWNISRDRYWGTPLPFWVCQNAVDSEAGQGVCNHTLAIGSVDELRRRAGSLPKEFDSHKPSIDEVRLDCETCGGKRTMQRTKSVLDCWFDSGAMPYAQYGWPHAPESRERVRDQFPADFIAEGLDQTRGWFYTLHAIGTFMTEIAGATDQAGGSHAAGVSPASAGAAGVLPVSKSATELAPSSGRAARDADLPDRDLLGRGPAYRTCVVNGLVLDKDGVKMSKRLGNVVDPWKAIEAHGADAVRWYLLASGSPWLPKRFDPNGLVETRRRFFGTLINSYKFFADYARLPDGFDPRKDRAPSVDERPEIDRWLVSRVQSLIADVRDRFEQYDLSGACRALDQFVVDELSNWYIRRNRARVWKGERADKLSAFATLHAALEATALLLAPIAPFLSEMLFERLSPGRGSVHAELVPEPETRWIDPELEGSMRVVERVVVMGRALRERAGLKIRQPLRAIHVRTSEAESLELLATHFARELVLGELNIRAIGSLAADDGRLCSLRAKANFKSLGPRLGARMKNAAQAIERLSAPDLARLRAGENVRLDVGGESIELTPADVQVTVHSNADFDVEADGRYIVWLETELDDELVAEGLAREAINRINGLRKESGLSVEERVLLYLEPGPDPLLERAVRTHAALIASETLSIELVFGARPSGAGWTEAFALGEGRVLTVGIVRASGRPPQ
jgi:isoleucyl-tRNA synthetase